MTGWIGIRNYFVFIPVYPGIPVNFLKIIEKGSNKKYAG
jgi:hypothetical protein